MTVLEGKSPAERNKIIAAILLGVLALAALFFAFGPNLSGGATKVTVSVSPTPRASATPSRELGEVRMPTREEEQLGYMFPVVYNRLANYAPDPGRNIFAFYEPPPPCPECPTPIPPTPKPIIAPPTPPLPFELAFVAPQSVYAGSKAFRLEVTGDRFTPDAKIYFNGAELSTTYVNPQRLAANVPANLITAEGSPQITVKTPDGTKYSLPSFMAVQPPPKPAFRYIGMIARRLGNNDTAYFEEQGKTTPTGYRLNDVVSGRFRLVDISSERVIFEDVNLGFRHPVELFRPPPGTVTSGPGPTTGRPGFPGGFPRPISPSGSQGIPGIPDGIPRYIPPNRNSNTNANRPKRNIDDDEDDEDTDN